MDVIRPIILKASNGHRFIFIVINYFTKWVKAASYANVTKSVVARFIKREIICRYGLSERIIFDNGLNLNYDMVAEICTRFKIKHHNSVPYQPKMNGAVEATNKNMKKDYSQGNRDIQRLAREAAFCITCLSNRSSDIDWGKSIFTGLRNGDCFAYRGGNSFFTSTK